MGIEGEVIMEQRNFWLIEGYGVTSFLIMRLDVQASISIE